MKFNANYAAAQTALEIVAAPAQADCQIVIHSLTFSSDGTQAGSVSLVQATAAPATVLGPYYFPATAGGLQLRFRKPVCLTKATNLGLTTTGTTNLTVTVEYDVEIAQ